MRPCKRLLLGTILALVLSVGVAAGAEEPGAADRASNISADALIEATRAALAAGNVDDAAFLLEGVEPGEGRY